LPGGLGRRQHGAAAGHSRAPRRDRGPFDGARSSGCLTMTDLRNAVAVLERGVEKGAFPGAVVLVSRGGEVLLHEAVGFRSLEPQRSPMRPDTVFDLASLTKPLAT